MSDNIRQSSQSRKVGRGLARLLRGLFGRRNVDKAGESWEVMKREFRAGRDGEEEAKTPKAIPHRDVEPDPGED